MDILARPDEPPDITWKVEAGVVAAAGVLLTLVAAVVAAMTAEKGGAVAGGLTLLVAVVAVAVEAVAVTVGLFVVGNLMGIDYGPVPEAVPKLVAVVLLVTGVTLAGCALACIPVGLVAGSLVGVPAFCRLFRVNPIEAAISVGPMAVAAWVVAALVFANQLQKMMPK